MTPDKSLQNLFNAALERSDAAERARFLDEACGADAALRERVEELLRAQEEVGAFMAQPSRKPASLDLHPTARVVIPLTEKPGDLIGRYKLLQQIGEGGCGVVYMAEQEEPVRRRVALKVIKLGMDTKQVIARFEAERQALALMDHPNIAKVLDAGATETGRPYFVMELVRGVKITEFCDENNLSTEDRLKLFIQVCQAIQHAHQKGIIHRDIKPSNVLVTINDDVPVPKVIDFGIAKATAGRLTDQTLFTAFEQFIGTPAYMSPEQAVMTSLDIDTRSDIYSLGVLLYELLTGGPPFDQKELLAAGLDEMRRIIRETEPPRPSNRLSTMAAAALTTTAHHRHTEPPRLVHAVRGDLDWVAMKCLEKDRARRYETANALAADIRRHLESEPVIARPTSPLYRFQKLARRNKLAVGAVAAVALSLVIGLAASVSQAVRATTAERLAGQRLTASEKSEKLAEQRLVESEQARAEAEAIAKFLSQIFISASPANAGSNVTVLKALERAAKTLDYDRAISPAAKAKLRQTIALTYNRLDLQRECSPLLEKVVDYYRSAFGPENTNTLVQSSFLAYTYLGQGRHDDAIKICEEYLPRMQKYQGLERLYTFWMTRYLAQSYYGAGRFDESVATMSELVPRMEMALGPEDNETLIAKHVFANSLGKVGRREESLKVFEGIFKARQEYLGPERTSTLSAKLDVARACYLAGRREEALKLGEEVVSVLRKIMDSTLYGPGHAMHAMACLASWREEAGRWDEALPLREELVLLRTRENGAEHPDTVAAVKSLASAYRATGDTTKAAAFEKQAAAVKPKAAPIVSDTGRPGPASEFAEAAKAARGTIERAGKTLEGPSRNGESLARMILAAALLADDDRAGYRAACADAVRRFKDTTNSVHAERVAKSCLLAPDSGVEVATLSNLVAIAQGDIEKREDKYEVQILNALAEYRLGHWDSAINWAEQSRASLWPKSYPYAAATAIKAMAKHHRQRPAEARAALEAVHAIVGNEYPMPNKPAWISWLIADLLAKEAEALLK